MLRKLGREDLKDIMEITKQAIEERRNYKNNQ
jgi:hypothetical protein